MDLTTSFQKVAEVSTKVTSNVTGYLRLYLKYGNRDIANNQDTIYYEIRQYAYNPYGNYDAWSWSGSLPFSIKNGSTALASGSYTQSAIKSDGTEKVRASGSWVQKHNDDGSFSATLTLSGYVYKTQLTTTGDISLPTIPVTPTLTINSASDMNTSGSTISYTLGNTGGRSTKIQYSTNNSTWNDWQTKSANDTYSGTLPNLLSTYPNTDKPIVYFRATNAGGTTAPISKEIKIDSSIKPSISSVTITPSNSISVLANANLFVKGLTKPIIKTSATAGTGSSISSYDLISLGGYNSNVSKVGIGNNYTYDLAFQKSGSINATVRVYDKRNRYVDKTSSNINVIDYDTPSLSISVSRCNQDGSKNTSGAYCKLVCKYNVYPIKNGSTNYNTKSLKYSLDDTNYVDININDYSGESTTIFGGDFATSKTYPIYARLQDLTTIVKVNTTLPSAETTVSKRAGGKGITFGQVATEDGFHDYLGANFHNGLKKNGTDVPMAQNSYSTSTTDSYSCDYVNGVINGVVESGSTDTGNWIKFSDGTMIWVGSITINQIPCDIEIGALYRCSGNTYGNVNYGIEFKETPKLLCTPFGNYPIILNSAGKGISKTSTGYILISHYKNEIIWDETFNYFVIGKWK